MASPTLAATHTGAADGATTTSHTVNLPASISAGDLLIVLVGWEKVPGTVTMTDWSSLAADDNAVYLQLFYKTASGSEGSTVSVTTVESIRASFVAGRITGWSGTPEKGTAATGTSATPDGPSLSPSGGSQDYLWISAWAYNRGDATSPTEPTNYSSTVVNGGGSAGGRPTVAAAFRALTASSEDPGAWSGLSTPANSWVAQTFAISPVPPVAALKAYSYRRRWV